ncbi:hypothetical protein [Phocaeicola sp.]
MGKRVAETGFTAEVNRVNEDFSSALHPENRMDKGFAERVKGMNPV